MPYFFITLLAVALTVWNITSFIRHPKTDPALAYATAGIQVTIIAGAAVLYAITGLFDLITWILK